MEDWAEIRRLHRAEGLSIKEIVRRTGVARNTVRAALRSDSPPAYKREPRGSIVDAVEPQIRALLGEFRTMPATVIAERIGWDRSLTVLKDRVRELRPLFLPPDPCQRTEYRPGGLAQWDLWFPAVDVPLGQGQAGRPPVIVGVAGYSRWLVARMIPTRQAHDILLGHLACLLELGGVPRKGVYDNEAALARRDGPGRARPTEAFDRFRGTLGMGVVFCQPGDPEAKRLVERAIRYLETSFLPGRRFSSPADFNAQLTGWLPKANNRIHAVLRCRPVDRVVEDRKAMLGFPPVLPDPALRLPTRLGRDHWVRVDTCDYSVQPRAIGRRVEIRVDLDEIVVRCERIGALGIITNGDRSFQQAKLVAAGLDLARFDPFVASMEVGAAKPSPAIYTAAAEARGADPSQCVMIGDSLNADVAAAHDAGYAAAVLIDRSASPRPGSVNSLAAALTTLRQGVIAIEDDSLDQ